MTAEAGRYAGLDRFECRKRIVEDMKALGLIEKIEPYRHAVGICYRSKTIVEPLVSTQWWVNVKPLAEAAILGSAVGLCMAGWRPVCEMQYDAFSYPALDQLINHVGRYRWRTRGGMSFPLTIRMPSTPRMAATIA